MKTIVTGLAALGLGVLIGAGAMHQFGGPSEAQPPATDTYGTAAPVVDERIAIPLLPEERLHVRGEMLKFLNGVQAISDATLRQDRETIGDVAGSLRRGDGSGRSIRQKVPDGFREISRGLRRDFGTIADMADTASMPEIQRALTDSLSRCSACHGTYRAVTETPARGDQP